MLGCLIHQALPPIVSFIPVLCASSKSNIAEMVDLEIGMPVHSRGSDQNVLLPKWLYEMTIKFHDSAKGTEVKSQPEDCSGCKPLTKDLLSWSNSFYHRKLISHPRTVSKEDDAICAPVF